MATARVLLPRLIWTRRVPGISTVTVSETAGGKQHAMASPACRPRCCRRLRALAVPAFPAASSASPASHLVAGSSRRDRRRPLLVNELDAVLCFARTIPLLPASLHRAVPPSEFLVAGNRFPDPRTAQICRARWSPASASRLCPFSASP
ncbi:uncharacterized protein [Triticum aestivum]|uniref:uncharacterized protein n=1 Tax=Triticum aestivum TaxID=4565 RepID=UPI001D02B6DA|nr:uncharacterized protein LOC123189532 [Triticum aestivum]